MRQAGYVLLGVLAGVLLAALVLLITRLPAGHAVTLAPSPTQTSIQVDVVGAVLRPGLYSFSDGSRVQDAITAAGGLLDGADLASLNLAQKLEDGQKLEVPLVGGAAAPRAATPGFQVVPGVPTPTSSANLLNINTASATQLDALPGIGPTTAQQIIDYRTLHGPFQHIEDLMSIPGIGLNTFDNIQELITVQ